MQIRARLPWEASDPVIIHGLARSTNTKQADPKIFARRFLVSTVMSGNVEYPV
ncbi:MAG: hypothetical protein U0359_26875 [Byssovorax sp.]